MITPQEVMDITPERFWKRIKFAGENECWEWQGSNSNKKVGYAKFYLTKYHPVKAHRHLFMQLFGQLTKWIFVCHKCDNKKCVNPNHLYAGTPKDNVNDRELRGRRKAAFGVNHGCAKLNDDDVRLIRIRIANGETLTSIGKSYSVDHSTIGYIKIGKLWKHVI